MTRAEEFKEALAAARISSRALAEWVGYASHTPIVRMCEGKKEVPEPLMQWAKRRAKDVPPRFDD